MGTRVDPVTKRITLDTKPMCDLAHRGCEYEGGADCCRLTWDEMGMLMEGEPLRRREIARVCDCGSVFVAEPCEACERSRAMDRADDARAESATDEEMSWGCR